MSNSYQEILLSIVDKPFKNKIYRVIFYY